jgi:Protein of unknown function (DUF1326)
MKPLSFLPALVLAASPAWAAPVVGRYVEARTAEVFAGGCIMSSEAETIGRQAVMAWRIDTGVYDGQALDGLHVVAAVSGDRNLGIREIGGETPSFVRAVVYVDRRGTDAQRRALAGLAQELSRGLITEVMQVTPVAITFDDTAETIAVAAGQSRRSVSWTARRLGRPWRMSSADGPSTRGGVRPIGSRRSSGRSATRPEPRQPTDRRPNHDDTTTR